jgi:phage head maturation protease
MKNNIPSEKIVPFIEEKLHLKFESLIDKKGVLVRKQGDGIVLDSTDDMSVIVRMSDTTTDRSGEVLIPEGCDYSEYMNNPVICLFHDYSILPVAKVTEIQVTDKSIFAKIKFGSTEKCKEIYQLVKDGILSATSVGFVATEELIKGTRQFTQYIKDNATRLTDVENINKIITKWTLLEDSFVSIPCNQNALVLAKTYTSEDMINKLAKLNKIDLKEAMDNEDDYVELDKKEEEVAIEKIEDAGSKPEEAFTQTEITKPQDVMPSQEIKEVSVESVESEEAINDNLIIHADTCECKECMDKKGCSKKEVEDKPEPIEEPKVEVKEEVIEEPKEEKVEEVEEVEEKVWKVISEPIDNLVKKQLEIAQKKIKGKLI